MAFKLHRLQRYFKVALVFLGTLAAGAYLVNLDARNRLLRHQRAVADIASVHGHLLQEQAARSLSATYALAAVLRQGRGKIDGFDALAGEMLHLYGGIGALQLAPGGVIARVVPLAGNEAAIGHNLLQDPQRNKESFSAIRTRQLTLAGPFTLRQGGVAVIGRLPVFLADANGGDRFWGFTIALIRIADLLEVSKLSTIAPSGYDYELSRVHPDTGRRDVFARSSTTPLIEPVSYVVDVPNGQWTLSMAPAGGWTSYRVLGLEALGVLLTSVLAALLTFNLVKQPEVLRREVALRTRELTETNRKLDAENFERHRAENALLESEVRFHTMADTVPMLIWMVGGDMRMHYVNQAWLAFTGRALTQEIGDGWLEALHPEDRAHCQAVHAAALADRAAFKAEFRLRHHDGRYRNMISHGVPRATVDEEFAGYIGSCLDVTDLKEAERVLRASHEELEKRVRERTAELTKANIALTAEKEHQHTLIKKLEEAQNQLLQSEKMASIGQLAAGVAHEINNPIGFVHSNLGTLKQYVDDLFRVIAAYEKEVDAACSANLSAAKQAADLDYLRSDLPSLLQETQEGVVRVKKIVQDLKAFSHVDETEWQTADLHQGLDSTLNVVWNELKYKTTVVKEYGAIPPVECIASQINQVFMNLLVNAAQAIDEKGIITIRSGRRADSVWVEIEDTGKGIPPENLHRIFEPFFTTKPVGKGTGLGLSLSYGIVKKHGGDIEVRSAVGRGSVFRVSLPIAKTNASAPAAQAG